MGCDKLFLNRQFVTFWEKGSGTNFWAKNLKSCVYLLLLFLLFIYFLFLKRENIPQSLRLCVGLDPSLRFKSFFFFFSSSCWSSQQWTVHPCTVYRSLQTSLFSKIFIKNGFYSTIHTFKNDFTTVFSVFNFQFQQNKFYPNQHLIKREIEYTKLLTKKKKNHPYTQIHEVLQFLYMNFYILKLLHNSSLSIAIIYCLVLGWADMWSKYKNIFKGKLN